MKQSECLKFANNGYSVYIQLPIYLFHSIRRDHDPLLNGRTSTKIADCSTKHRTGEKRICHGRIQCNNFCSIFYELGADGLRVSK